MFRVETRARKFVLFLRQVSWDGLIRGTSAATLSFKMAARVPKRVGAEKNDPFRGAFSLFSLRKILPAKQSRQPPGGMEKSAHGQTAG